MATKKVTASKRKVDTSKTKMASIPLQKYASRKIVIDEPEEDYALLRKEQECCNTATD